HGARYTLDDQMASSRMLRPAAADPARALRELFGYPSFRPGQAEIVAAALAGRDTLALLPTGAGKSLCYQLPAMLLEGVTLVVSPLIALMKDQLDGLPPAVAERSTLINSTLGRAEVEARLQRVADGEVKLVYAAPERLRQQPFLHALRRAGVALFVVDEAHCAGAPTSARTTCSSRARCGRWASRRCWR